MPFNVLVHENGCLGELGVFSGQFPLPSFYLGPVWLQLLVFVLLTSPGLGLAGTQGTNGSLLPAFLTRAIQAVSSPPREERQKPFAFECPWLGKIKACDSPAGCTFSACLALTDELVSVSPLSLPRGFPGCVLSCLPATGGWTDVTWAVLPKPAACQSA